MLAILASVAALLLGVAILNTGNGLFGTFLSLRMSLEGFPTEVTGLIMSAYYVGLVVGARTCHSIINRVGHIRAFSAFAATVSTIVLVAGFYVSPYAWGAMRAVLGFCFAGLFMVVESWLNARVGTARRGQLFSLYMMVSYSALGLGQLLLNLYDPRGRDFFMIAALLYSASLIPLALTSAATPTPVATSTLDFSALYRISPLGVLACVASGLVTSALYGMGAVFAQGSGFKVSEVSYFMGAAITSGLLFQYPLGRLSDRYDRRVVIVAVALATAVVSLGMAALAGRSEAALIALVCLYGGLSFTLYPLGVSHANDFLEPRDTVKASGGLLLSWGVGASAGPLAAAAVMARLGPRGLFLFVAGVTVLLALFTLWRMTRRPSVPAAAKRVFKPTTGMTAVGAEAGRTDNAEVRPDGA
ncbi:MAG TPA: MFS transporter [Alphaproteobacteria bacterium]|nr:MFS transporter [Alphaproteobacteria bacterium]